METKRKSRMEGSRFDCRRTVVAVNYHPSVRPSGAVPRARAYRDGGFETGDGQCPLEHGRIIGAVEVVSFVPCWQVPPPQKLLQIPTGIAIWAVPPVGTVNSEVVKSVCWVRMAVVLGV